MNGQASNVLRKPVCDELATVRDIMEELAKRPLRFIFAYTEDGHEVTVLRNVEPSKAKLLLERAQEIT